MLSARETTCKRIPSFHSQVRAGAVHKGVSPECAGLLAAFDSVRPNTTCQVHHVRVQPEHLQSCFNSMLDMHQHGGV